MLHDDVGKYRYTVEGLLGSGSFAQVVLAIPSASSITHAAQATVAAGAEARVVGVAVKVVKAVRECSLQSRTEVATMETLQKAHGGGKRGIVAMLGQFAYKKHLCIVYEQLGASLLDLLASRKFKGLPLATCSKLGAELLDAMRAMAEVGIIHCDLKPENILLQGATVEHGIKVVDFGSARAESQNHFQTYVCPAAPLYPTTTTTIITTISATAAAVCRDRQPANRGIARRADDAQQYAFCCAAIFLFLVFGFFHR